MGADCKSADLYLRWFKSSSAQTNKINNLMIRFFMFKLIE